MPSYVHLGSQAVFATFGRLAADYPIRGVIDKHGFTVELSGVDQDLGDETLFTALSDRVLAFVGTEVLSVAGAMPIADRLYRVPCVRGRFGTAIVDHAQGDQVFVLPRSAVVPLQHAQVQPGNEIALKVTPYTATRPTDLSEVDPVTVQLAGESYVVPAPGLVRVNDMTRNAGWDGVSPIVIDWVLPQISGLDVSQAYTQVEVLEGGIVTGSGKVPWPGTQLSYTHGSSPSELEIQVRVVVPASWNLIVGQYSAVKAFLRNPCLP